MPQTAAQKAHYEANKDSYRVRRRQYHARRKAWLSDLKAQMGCRRCRLRHPGALDLHHREGESKCFEIGKGVTRRPKSAVLAEIAKCEALCANCHRILHWEAIHGEWKE